MNTVLANPATLTGSAPAMPGPRPMPVLGWRGNLLPILRDPAVRLRRLQQSYGDIIALARDDNKHVFVFSPEYNHQLLSNQHLFYSLDSQSSDSPIRMPRDTAAARLFSGVAGMNGPKHTQQRRLLMPAFHKKRVDALRDTMVACTEAHIANWRSGQQIDIAYEMKELSMSLAVSGLLGLDPQHEGTHVRHLVERWSMSAMSIPVGFLQWDAPGTPYHRFLALSERLEAEFLAVIRLKRENSIDNGDALAILLQARDEDGGSLTDTELLGHLTSLFTAGHESTASALTWTLFLLSQHPHVLADLLDELDGNLHGDPPTVERLAGLPLLEYVINESMRLLPPVMWFLRTSTAPFTMGPYELPQGATILASPFVTHRREEIYPQPDNFLPARWKTLDPSPYEYMPFGGGPRRCLGATFAMMELRLVLPTILQRFRLSVPPGTRVDRSGTLLSLPKHRLPMTVSPQDRQFASPGVRGNIHDIVDFE